MSTAGAAWGHRGGARGTTNGGLSDRGGGDTCSYAGHGAGARLLDGQSISRLSCRAVALLFGCSSAALALRGDLEGAGIVLSYILAGW